MLQDQLKSFMYLDRSLRGDPNNYKLIDELNFTKCMQLKVIQKNKFFVGTTVKKRKLIIYSEFIVANHKIAYQFIKNLKSNPNNAHDLMGEMKRSIRKTEMGKSYQTENTKNHTHH